MECNLGDTLDGYDAVGLEKWIEKVLREYAISDIKCMPVISEAA